MSQPPSLRPDPPRPPSASRKAPLDAEASPRPPLPPVLRRIHWLWRLAFVGLVWAGGMLAVTWASGRLTVPVASPTPAAAPPDDGSAAPLATSAAHADVPTFTPGPTPAAATVAPPTAPLPVGRVGLLVGHWQHDSGTVCADGLREVDVTTDVALRTRAILEARGLTVDLLPEHDPHVPQPPTQGYRAAALVAIHADTCEWPGLSGFKVARWRYSDMPAVDDRLVTCLEDAYAAATGLPRNDDTISVNMWNYYAFREIGVDTPAAIIELAFLLGDRAFVDAHRYEMALGVADGISCFLEGR